MMQQHSYLFDDVLYYWAGGYNAIRFLYLLSLIKANKKRMRKLHSRIRWAYALAVATN